MSMRADIRDIEALKNLHRSFSDLEKSTTQFIPRLNSSIDQRVQAIRELVGKLHTKVELSRLELNEHRENYRSCIEQLNAEDNRSNNNDVCYSEQEAFRDAKNKLRKNEDLLNNANAVLSKLMRSIDRFATIEDQIKLYSNNELMLSISILGSLINGAESYTLNGKAASYHQNTSTSSLTAPNSTTPEQEESETFNIPKILLHVDQFCFEGRSQQNKVTIVLNDKGSEQLIAQEEGDTLDIFKLPSKPTMSIWLKSAEAYAKARSLNKLRYWTTPNEKDILKSLGYRPSSSWNNIVGGELSKEIINNINNEDLLKIYNDLMDRTKYEQQDRSFKKKIDPSDIYILDRDLEGFSWEQHDRNLSKESYTDLVIAYNNILERPNLQNDLKAITPKEEDVLRKFVQSADAITLIKVNNFYILDSNGRHRILAAKSLPKGTAFLGAYVTEFKAL